MHIPPRLTAAAHRDQLFDLFFRKNEETGGREEGKRANGREHDMEKREESEMQEGKAVPSRLLLFILKVCKVIKILLRLFSKHLFLHLFLPLHTL